MNKKSIRSLYKILFIIITEKTYQYCSIIKFSGGLCYDTRFKIITFGNSQFLA